MFVTACHLPHPEPKEPSSQTYIQFFEGQLLYLAPIHI